MDVRIFASNDLPAKEEQDITLDSTVHRFCKRLNLLFRFSVIVIPEFIEFGLLLCQCFSQGGLSLLEFQLFLDFYSLLGSPSIGFKFLSQTYDLVLYGIHVLISPVI